VTESNIINQGSAAETSDERYVTPRDISTQGTTRYTRFVGLMRFLLPVSAILLTATVVVWPYFNVTDSGSVVDIKTLNLPTDDRPTMANARFLGTDKKGQPFTVTATTAWQEQGYDELIYMEELQGDMMLDSGMWATIYADRGVYDQVGQLLIVESNVSVFTDEGYEIHSDYALIDLNEGTAEGDMPVSGQGPAGLIEAEGFNITDNGDNLFFEGRVHLTLFPGPQP
jgi:lipopolysaccharide export system protein LptC